MKPLIATRRGAVSLFPFMSILASLIGILTLLIGLSMAVNQKKEGMTEEDEPAQPAPPQPAPRLQQQPPVDPNPDQALQPMKDDRPQS